MAGNSFSQVRRLVLSFFLITCVPELAFTASLPRAWQDSPQRFDPELESNFSVSHNTDLWIRQDVKKNLQLMCLGASIVYGVGSSDGNGFRKVLRQALRYDGFAVNMVGSKNKKGLSDFPNDMLDDDFEAHPGDHIADVQNALVTNSLGYYPNVVVVNAGTNDANTNDNIAGVRSRMQDLLNAVWASPGYENPDACVILSTVLVTKDSTGAANHDQINNEIRALGSDLINSGKCLYMAELDGIVTLDDLGPDGIHPTDAGHRKMAEQIYLGILRASADNRIADPKPLQLGAAAGCEKTYANGIYAGGLTQKGSGVADGIYLHDSLAMGNVLNLTSLWDRNQWFTAKLWGDDKDHILGWYNDTDDTVHRYGVWKNEGTYTEASFRRLTPADGGNLNGDLDPDLFCHPAGVHFLDMNADGFDDIVCVGPDGALYLSINQKDGTDDKPPTFKRVSDTAKIMDAMPGFPQARIRMADIDGDGRGDYCVIQDNGDIRVWRNGWVFDAPYYWQDLGIIFKARGKGDIRGVQFYNINGGTNGDHWLWLDTVGAVETWTNARSCGPGVLGNGLHSNWRQGFHKGQSSGYTHYGVGDLDLSGDANPYLRDRIKFGNILGEPEDFGLKGRADYIFFQPQPKAKDGDPFVFHVLVWKNLGVGGAKLEIDGNKYCNMKGHSRGHEDYVWTWSYGRMMMYPNAEKGTITTDSYWGPVVDPIWDPTTFVGNGWSQRKIDRRDLHLADWDGDGKCDIIWADSENSHRVQVWLNRYDGTTFNWDYQANPAPVLSCEQKRGKNVNDLAVRFAYISNTKKADYLCIEKDGRVTGFIRSQDGNGNALDAFRGDSLQIKFSEGSSDPNKGKDRVNLRWADVNGDGLDDMIWADKFTGDGSVWYNRGYRTDTAAEGGSSFHWESAGPAYAGSYAGTCQYFPDLDGNGRADLHSIIGTWTNMAKSWLNPSCGNTDSTGDDDDIKCGDGICNPGFPDLPPSGGGGGPPGGSGVVLIGSQVWDTQTCACYPPCVLVLPGLAVPLTTISVPPYTTSLEVLSTVTTITVNIPPIVTNEIPMSNIAITPSVETTVLQPLPSITIPQTVWVVTWVTDGATSSSTRTIDLPPWPQITMGPPEGWGTFIPPTLSTTTSSTVVFPPIPDTDDEPTVSWPPPLVTWTPDPPHFRIEPVTTRVTKVEQDVDDSGRTVVKLPCDWWPFFLCIKLGDVEMGGFSVVSPPGIYPPGPPPDWAWKFPGGFHIDGPLPPWPKLIIGWGVDPIVPDNPDKPDSCQMKDASICPLATVLSDATATTTTYWEDISSCVSYSGCFVQDWEPTTSGDACSLPPQNLKNLATAAATATDSTSPATATAQATSWVKSSPGPAVSLDAPIPTSTAPVASSSAAMLAETGMEARVRDIEVEERDQSEHDPSKRQAGPPTGGLPSLPDENDPKNWANDKNCPNPRTHHVIYPATRNDQTKLNLIRDRLDGAGLKWIEFNEKQDNSGDTYWFHVDNMPVALSQKMNRMYGVVSISYDYVRAGNGAGDFTEETEIDGSSDVAKPLPPRTDLHRDRGIALSNNTDSNNTDLDFDQFTKRDAKAILDIQYFRSQISVQAAPWAYDVDSRPGIFDSFNRELFRYRLDDTEGYGQHIYLVDSELAAGHPEFTSLPQPQQPQALRGQIYGNNRVGTDHGTGTGSVAAGAFLGIAPLAQLHYTATAIAPNDCRERYLEALLLVLRDIRADTAKQGTSVVNMSWGILVNLFPSDFGEVMLDILQKLDSLGTVLVTSAGNAGAVAPTDVYWPNRLLPELPNLIVVGATNETGFLATFSQRWASGAPNLLYAPGVNIRRATAVSLSGGYGYDDRAGTSYSSPMVAALVAYWRGLPSRFESQLRIPALVKNLLKATSRSLVLSLASNKYAPKTVWNLMVRDKNCLLDEVPGCSDQIPEDLSTINCAGQTKRDGANDACLGISISPGGGGDGSGGGGGGGGAGDTGGIPVSPISFRDDQPSPTCTADCGTVCTGFFCVPTPNGHPPAYSDPANTPPPPPPPPPPATTTQATTPTQTPVCVYIYATYQYPAPARLDFSMEVDIYEYQSVEYCQGGVIFPDKTCTGGEQACSWDAQCYDPQYFSLTAGIPTVQDSLGAYIALNVTYTTPYTGTVNKLYRPSEDYYQPCQDAPESDCEFMVYIEYEGDCRSSGPVG